MNLKEYEDIDLVMQEIGETLGVLPPDSFTKLKWVTWSNNPIGNALGDIMQKLEEIGYLQRSKDDDMKIRINPDFKVENTINKPKPDVQDAETESELTV